MFPICGCKYRSFAVMPMSAGKYSLHFTGIYCQANETCGFRIPGSRWAFERAKENLLNHYLLVGTTDEMLDFVAVLEATLPRFFKGAVTKLATGKSGFGYNGSGTRCPSSFLGKKSHLRKTVKKIPPSEKTVERIQRSDIWKLEHEFYEFAKAQFRFVKERLFDPDAVKYVGGGGDAETGGVRVPVARKKEFHYEKIKP